ncbi:mitochondrial thiamine pyrophosphate transporter, partial [Spiromyces aspiralis]
MQDQQALPMPLHRYSYPAATTIPAALPAQQHSADPAVRRHHHPPEEVITAPSSEITSKRAAPKQASHHRIQSVSRGLNGWQSAFCGSVAGLVSRAVIAPLDVAKITLQLQTQRVKFGLVQSGRPTGMLGCMLRIYREEGIR